MHASTHAHMHTSTHAHASSDVCAVLGPVWYAAMVDWIKGMYSGGIFGKSGFFALLMNALLIAPRQKGK